MQTINTMPEDEYYSRMTLAIGEVRQKLFRLADEAEHEANRLANHGKTQEALRKDFVSRAFSNAAFLLLKHHTK